MPRWVAPAAGLVVVAAMATSFGLAGSTHITAGPGHLAAQVGRRAASPDISPPSNLATSTASQGGTGAGAGTSSAAGITSAAGGAGGSGAAGGAGAPPLPPGSTGQSAKVEETGALALVVRAGRVSDDVTRLMALAVAQGGFASSSATQGSGGGATQVSTGTVTLQVPEPSFAAVLAECRALGQVSSLTTTATDVTGQYVDLQARITALQDSRQQYLTIMSKAGSVGDVLAVQSQLDDLQSQLEQLQGQLQVLDAQTTYATLSVTLSSAVPPPVPTHPASGLGAAWHGALSSFAEAADAVVRASGSLAFTALLLLALYLLVRGVRRLVRRPRPMPGGAPPPVA